MKLRSIGTIDAQCRIIGRQLAFIRHIQARWADFESAGAFEAIYLLKALLVSQEPFKVRTARPQAAPWSLDKEAGCEAIVLKELQNLSSSDHTRGASAAVFHLKSFVAFL